MISQCPYNLNYIALAGKSSQDDGNAIEENLMINPSCISTAVWPSELAEAQVILTGQENGSAGTEAALKAGAGRVAACEAPILCVPDLQPSFAEMVAHLDRISPFGKDSEQAQEFRRRYIHAWNSCLEMNLIEIEKGDQQDVKFYFYQVGRSDAVCCGHLLQKTFVSRSQIRAFPQVIPPFHLGCSCRLKRYLYVPDCPSGRALIPLFEGDELPVLPEWSELAEVPESAEGQDCKAKVVV